MPQIDPAALESRGAVSVDLTELHDAALRRLSAEAVGSEAVGE